MSVRECHNVRISICGTFENTLPQDLGRGYLLTNSEESVEMDDCIFLCSEHQGQWFQRLLWQLVSSRGGFDLQGRTHIMASILVTHVLLIYTSPLCDVPPITTHNRQCPWWACSVRCQGDIDAIYTRLHNIARNLSFSFPLCSTLPVSLCQSKPFVSGCWEFFQPLPPFSLATSHLTFFYPLCWVSDVTALQRPIYKDSYKFANVSTSEFNIKRCFMLKRPNLTYRDGHGM